MMVLVKGIGVGIGLESGDECPGLVGRGEMMTCKSHQPPQVLPSYSPFVGIVFLNF